MIPIFIETRFGKIFAIFHKGNKDKPLIILVHGYQGNHLGNFENLFVYLARKLEENKYNVLRFDLIGHRNSDLGKILISSMVNQLIEITEFCKKNFEFNGIVLIGHSRGFWISILAQEKIKDLKALISLAGRVRNLKYFMSKMEIDYLIQNKKDFKEYYEDDSKYDYKEYISKIKVPVLLIYGKKDDIVYYTEAFEFKKYYKGRGLRIVFWKKQNMILGKRKKNYPK